MNLPVSREADETVSKLDLLSRVLLSALWRP